MIDNIASISSEILEVNDAKSLFDRGLFLKSLTTNLKALAYKHDIAIIIINNVVASFSDDYKKSQKVYKYLQ